MIKKTFILEDGLKELAPWAKPVSVVKAEVEARTTYDEPPVGEGANTSLLNRLIDDEIDRVFGLT